MIQRIQTIFLFLAVVLLIALNFFPYWQSHSGNEVLYSYGYQTIKDGNTILEFGIYVIVSVLAGIAAIIALIELFMFKNRVLQMLLSVVNSFIFMITMGLMAYLIFELQRTISGNFAVSSYLLALAMFFNVLARRFIQKDEKLVRSVDRIR